MSDEVLAFAEFQLAMQAAYADYLQKTNRRASDKAAAEFAQEAILEQPEEFAAWGPTDIFLAIAGTRVLND